MTENPISGTPLTNGNGLGNISYMSKVSDQLRKAIADSGKSGYLIAKESGIGETGRISMLRWLNRTQKTITSDLIDVLADYLGLELRHKTQGDK